MSPTGSASWWPWQSSIIAHKDEVIALKDKLIAEKETQLKDLKTREDKLIAEKDKLIAEKDKFIQEKDIRIAEKETQLKDLKSQLLQQEMQSLQELSRVKVIANNRALIENAMQQYKSDLSLSKGLEMFVNEHLLTVGRDKTTLSMYGREVCNKLRNFGFAAKEDFVQKELKNLMHEISKPLHRPHVSGKIYTGYVVGGEPPLAEALAIVISKLQECKFVKNLDVLLVDGEGKCKCVLSNGDIVEYGEA
ncbi:hypothetical protein GUITHDRAFT_119694 [Guillardia theta CCMP2712]|uniref:Uncharacterized protein n=1 Tax=Guillardia theta (strain CCMP2712) TaxID=905079 RepID=L1IE03_GUITC|nr:hypothetical protein GUITHDRAFT_119694 [Guillardia theta CCMP2712]EKX34139.1 hypothetical protein GUITHDRAFT_119694 [Guillardia theta CCMP2712]|eukprot:XP_005821119.1 hypothetical protein GUITHDRAFT_119694 [Guillardia theta CCMP2712]